MTFKITTRKLIGTGKTDNNIIIPNISRTKFMIPSRIDVFMIPRLTTDAVFARELQLDFKCGGCKLLQITPAWFKLSNTLNLTDYRSVLDEGTDMSCSVTNHNIMPVEVILEITYVPTYGKIIYQNTHIASFNSILSMIYEKGTCTKLILAFNKPVRSAMITSLYTIENTKADSDANEEEEDEWCHTLQFPDTSDEANSLTLDFTAPDYRKYPGYLNLMEFCLSDADKEREKATENTDYLTAYVIAYGFSK